MLETFQIRQLYDSRLIITCSCSIGRSSSIPDTCCSAPTGQDKGALVPQSVGLVDAEAQGRALPRREARHASVGLNLEAFTVEPTPMSLLAAMAEPRADVA